MIQSIESIHLNEEGVVYVSAVVEDMVLTYPQTLYDPPEYGPALCEAEFSVDESEIVPDNEQELIDYLENLDLEWVLIDNSDDYVE